MGGRAVFITTKNLDYLRNVQEIELLKKKYDVVVVGASDKGYFKRLVKVYLRILTLSFRHFDEVFVGFAPQLIIPFWKWKFRRNHVTIDFFISLYDTMVFDRKKLKEQSLISKLLKKIDEITIKMADDVIVDTKEHGKYFAEELNADPKNMKVLYLNADISIYYPRECIKPKVYEGRYVVLYFGSILPLQGIEVIVKAAEALRDRADIHFEIIGPIQDSNRSLEPKNITFIPWLSQEELAEHIAYADLCLAGHFNKDIMKAKRTIPGKAYIYRAMDKPMILGDNPANHELYNDGDEGIYYVRMGDPEALAAIIKTIRENAL